MAQDGLHLYGVLAQYALAVTAMQLPTANMRSRTFPSLKSNQPTGR